ncbi:MAG: DUF4159 domain-containing protein [Pirellulales bacterium]
MRGLRELTTLAFLLALWAIGASRAQAQGLGGLIPGLDEKKEITAADIRRSIDLGTKYLLSVQNPDGSWSGNAQQPGGATALATLALLNSGVPAEHPQIVKALAMLRTQKPEKVYASSLIIMTFCAVEPSRFADSIAEHAAFLVRTQDKGTNDRAFLGGWAYGDAPSRPDNSNSQFALLGLYEAERAEVKVKVPTQVWKDALDYWKAGQNASGSWAYTNRSKNFGTGSMTCAGVSSLIICQSKLSDGDAALTAPDILQCCRGSTLDDEIEQGLKWLGNRFTVDTNPAFPTAEAGGKWLLYYLYGIERIGRLSGRRFFYSPREQPYDWYRLGAEKLIGMQDANLGGKGAWTNSENLIEGDTTVATSLALLFLSKGRRPVVIGKARWGNERDQSWNRHRSDVANLTSYVEKAWRKDFPIGLSWQVVDLEKNPAVEDLLQTPVLFISGSGALPWADDKQRIQLLRDYIDRGGFVFAEACCNDTPGAKEFDRDFRRVMQAVFADRPENTLKRLDPAHPIWRAERQVPVEGLRYVEGIDYGCRTCLVYVPPGKNGTKDGNLGCWWELNFAKDRPMGDEARKRMDGAHYLGLNVLAYATNRELKGKDETLNLKEDRRPPDTGRRDLIYLAKLRHPGECDTAPGAAGDPARGGDATRFPRGGRIAIDRHHGGRVVRLSHGLHARPQVVQPVAGRANAIEEVRRIGGHDFLRRDLLESGFRRFVSRGDEEDLPERTAGTDRADARTDDHQIQGLRFVAGRASPPPPGRRCARRGQTGRPAGTRRREDRRSLRRNLFEVRFELCARTPRLAGMRRLLARRRRTDQLERAAVFAGAVRAGNYDSGIAAASNAFQESVRSSRNTHSSR